MVRAQKYSYDLSIKSDVSDELINVYVMRPVAGALVRFLFHTPITPNHVTLGAMSCGLVAAALYFTGTPSSTILAGVFITLKDLLDSADGQLARAKTMYSRAGRFLDSIGDITVNLAVFAAIGYTLSMASGNVSYAMLAAAGFVGMTLRVSYHVFYQTSFLHLRQHYATNRITEEVRQEDVRSDRAVLNLQRIFQALYGWQDRMMVRIDGWCRAAGDVSDEQWFGDAMGLRLSGFLGLGTELMLLTVCSVLNQLPLYLYCNLILMNGILIASILYRRRILCRRVNSRP